MLCESTSCLDISLYFEWQCAASAVKHYFQQEEMSSVKFSVKDPGIIHKGYRYQPVEPVVLHKVGLCLVFCQDDGEDGKRFEHL